jgi:hypothetical protein
LFSPVAFGQTNICLDSINAPEEVSLAISPKDPSKIVAGANIINYYYSGDTGRTWKNGFMKSPYGVWGDPIVQSDTGGWFYFFHLSTPPDGHWIDRMVCQRSKDGGKTWSDGAYTGLNGERNQDKPGCAIDMTNSPYENHIYLAWTQFDLYESRKPTDSSRILFSYSSDRDSTWSKPVRIDSHAGDCLDGDNTVEGAVPAVGPDGQVYVAWGGPEGLVFNRSMDGGKTWLPREIKIGPIIGGWDFDIPGINRCDGMPVICCDISNGPHRGTIYVNWCDQRNGSDNTDIWLVKSTDQGNTWSEPICVNNDTGNHQQFLTWMSVDPFTGYIYCVFYDRRNHQGDTTDVYMAVSKDGGNSFVNFRINGRSFLPTSVDFFGDYISIQARNNIVRPIWMQLQNHRLSIWTSLINPGDLDWVTYKAFANAAVELKPLDNVSKNESLWFKFKLRDEQEINLSLIDMWGKTVCKLLTDKSMERGEQEYILDLAHRHIAPGAYAYKLETNRGIIYKPVVVY